MSSEIKVDTISEKTSANGVVIDGVTLKDSKIGGTITIPGSTGTMALTSDISSGGLVHLSTDTFTTASSFTKDSIFSATYDYYNIVGSVGATNNANGTVTFLLRGSASDVTSNYQGLRNYSNIGSGSASGGTSTGTGSWYVADAGGADADRMAFDIMLYKPFVAVDTRYACNGLGPYASAWYYQQAYGYNSNDTSYDGFKLNYSGTEFTGSVSIFGLVKS